MAHTDGLTEAETTFTRRSEIVVADLVDAWCALVGVDDTARAAGTELVERYREPHRRYHDFHHVSQVLAHIDDLGSAADDETAVLLAAFFHDAVYEPASPDNEEASAELAASTLVRLGHGDRAPEVARLVRLTSTHAPAPSDYNGAVLCDADLAILGSSPEAYAAYAAAVRAEYHDVDDESFRQGRSAVLRSLLARPAIFSTPRGSERWEARARRNIEAELILLDAQSTE